MIVVDTSALMAILLREPEAAACAERIEGEDRLLISAVTVAEALIVATRRGFVEEMTRLLDGLGFEVVEVGRAVARRASEAYARWGKGIDPAALNFGDCFAYELAVASACPLLFVGQDFALTDVKRAL